MVDPSIGKDRVGHPWHRTEWMLGLSDVKEAVAADDPVEGELQQQGAAQQQQRGYDGVPEPVVRSAWGAVGGIVCGGAC